MRKTGVLLVAVAVASIASGAHARPSAPSTPAEDVRLLSQMIQTTHPEPFRSVTRARFRAEVNAAAQRAAGLEPNQRLVDLLRIIALLGPRNGHTGAFPLDPGHSRELHPYPLRLYDFSDGIHVVDEPGDLGLVGSRLVAVEGRPIGEVLARVRPLVPRDNSSHLRGLAPHYLLVSEILDGLGLVDGTGPAEMTFERPSGERVERTLTPIAAGAYRAAFADPIHGHYPSVLPTAPKPLYLSGARKTLWTRTLAGGRAVYVGYNAVVPPSPAVVRKIRRLARGSKVRRVIVDVRRNGGGDNTTYGPLTSLFSSKSVNRRGRLYVLIGRATFSAAANFAAEIDNFTRATFVGEPTGGGVETYGDTNAIILPTSGLNVHIAAQYHSRQRGPKDRRLAVAPDVRIEPSSKDYVARRDPVLDRALRGL
jgi:peptidase S41-like protein